MSTRHRRYVLLASIAALLVTVALMPWRKSKGPPFADEQFLAATLELHGPPLGVAVATAQTGDPVTIRQLTHLLDRGSPTEPHLCAAIGHLLLKRADGSVMRVEILPGHDDQFYEFRHNGVYSRVVRADFLRSIAPFGVPDEMFAAPTGQ